MSDLRTERGARPVPGDEQQGGSPKRMITAAIALGAVAAFGIGIWFAYDQGVKRGSSGAPPLIRADQGPTKVAPENPGGMQVPNQDKQIYDRIGGQPGGDDGKTERLLPPPERPSANVATAPASGPAGSAPSVTVPMRPAPSPVPNQAPASQAVTGSGIPNQTSAPSPMPLVPQATTAEPKPAPDSKASTGAAKPTAEKPAATAKPATAAPAKTASLASPGGSAKVQLASLKDQADAQATWSRLEKKFPELSGLTPTYEKVEIPNKGAFVRLQVGPLKDRAAAQALCQQLAAKNQGCIVVSK
jgi:cell division septation protein DedD